MRLFLLKLLIWVLLCGVYLSLLSGKNLSLMRNVRYSMSVKQ